MPRGSPAQFKSPARASREAAFSPLWFQVPGRLVLPATWNQEPPKWFLFHLRWHVTPAAAGIPARTRFLSALTERSEVSEGRMPAPCNSAIPDVLLSRPTQPERLLLLRLVTSMQWLRGMFVSLSEKTRCF